MSLFAMPYKGPDELLDYKIDMTAELAGRLAGPADDTITAVTWVMPTGLTKTADTHDNSSVTVWLSGGTLGSTYEVKAEMTTSGGRVYERSFKLAIKDR